MTWAFKRQAFYLVVLIIFICVFGFLLIRPTLNKPPTCTDGKMNGTETGVDCGGTCAKACLDQVDPISVIWSRVFRVVPGRYNAVAYLENHNRNTAVNKVNYKFRFADKNNIYIGQREGTTYVPPSGSFVVFEPGVDTGSAVPVYVTFEIVGTPYWVSVSQEKINQLKVSVSDITLTDETTSPRLVATVKNNSLFIIPEINIVVILYDNSHNAVSASRTYLSKLGPEETRDITFTWPEAFENEIVNKEVIPMYNFFSVKLK